MRTKGVISDDSIALKVLNWLVHHGEPADINTIMEGTGLRRDQVERTVAGSRYRNTLFLRVGEYKPPGGRKPRGVFAAWED